MNSTSIGQKQVVWDVLHNVLLLLRYWLRFFSPFKSAADHVEHKRDDFTSAVPTRPPKKIRRECKIGQRSFPAIRWTAVGLGSEMRQISQRWIREPIGENWTSISSRESVPIIDRFLSYETIFGSHLSIVSYKVRIMFKYSFWKWPTFKVHHTTHRGHWIISLATVIEDSLRESLRRFPSASAFNSDQLLQSLAHVEIFWVCTAISRCAWTGVALGYKLFQFHSVKSQ